MELSSLKKLNKTFLNFIAPKKLNKNFYTIDKTTVGETGYLSNFHYLLAAEASSFLIYPLSQTQSIRTLLVPYY